MPISESPVGWKDSADTVIIGGGINGCSVAYHLAKQVNDQADHTLMLERELSVVGFGRVTKGALRSIFKFKLNKR